MTLLLALPTFAATLWLWAALEDAWRDTRIQRKMDALDRLGSWGMQRPELDQDGYPVEEWELSDTGSEGQS